jgi:hypothetical protein
VNGEQITHLEVRATASNGSVIAYDQVVAGPSAVLPRLLHASDLLLADLREQGLA